MESLVNLNHGRWCAPCPACNASYNCDGRTVHDSSGNAFACPVWGQPELTCALCGATSPIVWPDTNMRGQIELAVGQRPIPHQNWQPGETVEWLHVENDHPEARLP